MPTFQRISLIETCFMNTMPFKLEIKTNDF